MPAIRERFSIPLAVTALGLSAVITQITVIREFINVFEGNEVVLGLLFAFWLLYTGAGAWLAKFIRQAPRQKAAFQVCLFCVALLPPLLVAAIRLLRNHVFIRGELPGVADLILTGSAVLLPYCLVSGALLTLACALHAEAKPGGEAIGRIYFLDSLGSIVGGLLFTFVLVRFFGNLTSLLVPALLCLAAFLLLPSGWRTRPAAYILGFSAFILALSGFFIPVERFTIERLFAGQEVIDFRESPYGRIVITREHDQISFFENGAHLFSTPNTFASEETVHYALPQIRDLHSVMLISGSVAGVPDEVLKYGVKRLDCVELDPAIIELGLRHLGIRHPGAVRLHLEDGRKYVERSTETYDAILLSVPPPDALQLNRCYAREFFEAAKSRLRPGGVLSFAVPGAENYISPDQAALLSTLKRTLQGVFNNVLIIPGERNIFIASDGLLSADAAALIEAKKIQTTYVNRHYLAGRVTPERLAFVAASLRDDVPENRDFRPVAFFFRMKLWLAMFQQNHGPILIGAAVLFLFYFLRISMVRKTLFTTGFLASAMEIVILLSYQILHGTVYTGIGFIVAAFMFGLAAGSLAASRVIERGARIGKGTLLGLEGAILAYTVVYILALAFGRGLLTDPAFALLTAVIGALTGAEFPVAARLISSTPGETAGSLYAADLFGASLGAAAVSLFLIPAMGIYMTCLILLAVKVLVMTALALWRNGA
ncbi:MAG TPA: fused MFS/spermidine synthase [Syntrophales bacterium]|nr:fused MFS/spermidine synthase [Syntrophales bacterium]HOX95279.1 fused MFS/spermidine synthase [Syntrophales bacterium]HPI58172.1 fused MFS/spermidine synthase [Syntrophales bacterium]HPN26010.1 fused MFS/spermidine synthase [Syntrophales bacterium]HQM30337.1 fused MFS/spermidine synthase [Syntrophales bacterium]